MDLYLYLYSFDWYEVTQTTAFRLLLLISLLTLDVFIYVITQPNSLLKTAVLKIFIRRYKPMSMYFIGIDISKYKHDCCIISAPLFHLQLTNMHQNYHDIKRESVNFQPDILCLE